MDKDFVIVQVGWDLRPDNRSNHEGILSSYAALVELLEANGLLRRPLLAPGRRLGADFKLLASDLTEEGLNLLRQSYSAWLRARDRGADPLDMTILEKGLAKLRRTEKRPLSEAAKAVAKVSARRNGRK